VHRMFKYSCITSWMSVKVPEVQMILLPPSSDHTKKI